MGPEAPSPPWTANAVERQLIETFRWLPFCPVFSRSTAIRTSADTRNELADALEWATLLVGDPDGRKYLWAWVRCQATRSSFAELCREMGWPRSTAVADQLQNVPRHWLEVITQGDGQPVKGCQAPMVPSTVPKAFAPGVRRAVATTVRTAASPVADHIAR